MRRAAHGGSGALREEEEEDGSHQHPRRKPCAVGGVSGTLGPAASPARRGLCLGCLVEGGDRLVAAWWAGMTPAGATLS